MMRPMTFFRKMHGLGNDFVVLDARKETLTLSGATVKALADRRRGVGCDQVIVIAPGRDGSDVSMRILNADGSEVEACGNATRCVASLVMGETGQTHLRIRTVAGLLLAEKAENGMYAVDMGPAITEWDKIPLARKVDTNRFALPLKDRTLEAAAVSMGNPHCVLFVEDAEKADVSGIGPEIEVHSMFPKHTNVEFVTQIGEKTLRMRVWERGVGITSACGTGACATAFAAFRRKMTGDEAEVVLDGGSLWLKIRDGHVIMRGPATLAYTGEINLHGLPA